jgi:hypothetical protein
MKRSHLNLALSLVVAGLIGAVVFSQKKDEKGPPLTSLAADALRSIAIEYPDRPAVKLQKQEGKWRLVEPVQADTDPLEVASLEGLATLQTRRVLELSEVTLSQLGLEPPVFRVRLNDVVLDFGGIEPIEARRYVLTGGKVALVDDPPSAAMDPDYSDLVAKALVPDGAEIEKIALPGFAVERSADGKAWTLVPEQPEAAATAAEALIDRWKNARAMWMAAEPPQGSAGEPVEITLKGGARISLLVVEREPQLVIARPDLKVRYTLSKALEAELLSAVQKKAETPPPAAAPSS